MRVFGTCASVSGWARDDAVLCDRSETLPMEESDARTDPTGSRLALVGEALRAAGRLKITVWLLGILAALAVAWTLRETRMVTMPLAFAFFIAIAVFPVSAAVSARVPRRLRWL